MGTGVDYSGIPPVPTTCLGCNGEGYRVRDRIDTTDIMDKLDNIWNKLVNTKEKCDAIKERCDQIWDKVK